MSKKPRPTPPKATPEELAANTLLLTPIGSHLYGLAHADSDEDFYRIVPDTFFWKAVGEHNKMVNPKIMARQHINNGIDEITISLKTFAQFAFEGVPQALEAMFSQQTIIDRLEDFRKDYFAGTGMESMRERYRRTIHRFAYGDFKSRRHALRLSINLEQAMKSGGRFNPTLNTEQAAFISQLAASTPQEYIAGLEKMNHYQIADDWDMAEIEANF